MVTVVESRNTLVFFCAEKGRNSVQCVGDKRCVIVCVHACVCVFCFFIDLCRTLTGDCTLVLAAHRSLFLSAGACA